MNESVVLTRKRRRWQWSIGWIMVLIAGLALTLGGVRYRVDQRRLLVEREMRMARQALAQANATLAVSRAQAALQQVEVEKLEAENAVNELSSDDTVKELKRLRQENEELRREVERLQANPTDPTSDAPD